jgi:hypothetical protein
MGLSFGDRGNLVAQCAKLLMEAGNRVQHMKRYITPEWALCYEEMLDRLWRNCTRAAKELYMVMCRYGIPRDVRLLIVRVHVKQTWLSDCWISDDGTDNDILIRMRHMDALLEAGLVGYLRIL